MQRLIISKPVEGVVFDQDINNTKVCLFNFFGGKLPKNTKFYSSEVSAKNIIEINDKDDIDKVTHPETLHVVVYPDDATQFIGEFLSIFNFFGTPETPNPVANTRTTSPNNELSSRSNQARPNARIPDIYGLVRSTPDLIAQPYTIYEDNTEIEISYSCVGRGSYDVSDIRDGDTPASRIDGTSIEVYAPNTSPNSGTAQLTIGDAISDPLVTTIRVNEVNGQVLNPPNQNVLEAYPMRAYDNTQDYGNPATAFKYFFETSTAGIFEGQFEAGQSVVVTDADYTDVNLNGTYEIESIVSFGMVLVDPDLVNAEWADIETDYSPAHNTEYKNVTLSLDIDREIGAFILDQENIDSVYINIIAQNGLYKKSGSTQIRVDVDIEIDMQPVDASFSDDGTLEQYTDTIEGSNIVQSTRAKTFKITPATSKRYKITVRRTSDTDTSFSGNVVDEVKLKDIFIVKNVSELNFGDVTTIYSKVIATPRATSVKERKLNLLAHRKIPTRISGDTFTTSLTATSRADHIICAMALDALIGRVNIANLDVDNIYDTISEIEAYFGTSKAIEFNYTFDNDNLSFEEMLTTLCKAIYCHAYRQSGKIKISFEKETDISVLLFNHRNKMPNSEQRNISFGNQNDYDGVELTWVNPETDAEEIFYLPSDKSATSPKKVNASGVRNKIQAYFWAHREYNKILNERITVEFDALQEADLLVIRDRILVSDNTRADVIDGEIRGVSGLTITLSQPIEFLSDKTYNIFLQLKSGTVQSIPITAGSNNYEVILGSTPSDSLIFGSDKYAPTTYLIVSNDDSREKAFIVTERQISDNYISKIKAVNYSDDYYANDQDYNNSVINENGDVI